jgi:hypothetical protein
MKTAVEWYAEQEVILTLDFISKKISELEYGLLRLELLNKANKMFEEQIIGARQDGFNRCFRKGDRKEVANEQYYNETFKSE